MVYTLFKSAKTFPESINFEKMVFDSRYDAYLFLQKIANVFLDDNMGAVLDGPNLELKIYNGDHKNVVNYLLKLDQQ